MALETIEILIVARCVKALIIWNFKRDREHYSMLTPKLLLNEHAKKKNVVVSFPAKILCEQ